MKKIFLFIVILGLYSCQATQEITPLYSSEDIAKTLARLPETGKMVELIEIISAHIESGSIDDELLKHQNEELGMYRDKIVSHPLHKKVSGKQYTDVLVAMYRIYAEEQRGSANTGLNNPIGQGAGKRTCKQKCSDNLVECIGAKRLPTETCVDVYTHCVSKCPKTSN